MFLHVKGWRWTFILAGLPGIILGFLIMATVREPERQRKKQDDGTNAAETKDPNETNTKLKFIVQSFSRPSVIMLCLAGSIRNAG